MMNLEAICMGYAVPHVGFEAEVHSAFASAANLLLMRGGRLLTLVGVEEADLPQGIRVDTPQGFSFEGLRIRERVSYREGILRWEQAALTIDLRRARRWKCDLPGLAANLKNPPTLAAWQSVTRALEERRMLAGMGLPAGHAAGERRMDENISELEAATRRYDLTAANKAAAALVGLGSGLTPGGDDLLVGYLAGSWCAAGERPERLQFVNDLGKAIVRLSRGTNDISRTYLAHAARGQVSSKLAALAEAICRGERQECLLETADAAMRVGHSSGMEAVRGLLAGMVAWSVRW
jgi:hypothetical protein